MSNCDVIILGAGAAGMMCAIEAARRGRRVVVADHARAPGEKIRISGGGRCNFTNLHCAPDRFLSDNPHFIRSALARYTPSDFIARVEQRGIAWHEKEKGQLFCDGSARQIVDMLLDDLKAAGGELRLEQSVGSIRKTDMGFSVDLNGQAVDCEHLVVATGGKSIPKMGATGFAYQIAEQFDVPVITPRPGLVPLTFPPPLLERFRPLAGVSVPAHVSTGAVTFDDPLLFTHRGLSGPGILQISSYWREGDAVQCDLLPEGDVTARIKLARQENGRQSVRKALSEWLPNSLAGFIADAAGFNGNLADLNKDQLARLDDAVHRWTLKPTGSEGYRTAEVTVGGIDTRALHQATMEVRAVPGLYFIGEAVDVTGWLGGYNFQWAWASGYAAGQVA